MHALYSRIDVLLGGPPDASIAWDPTVPLHGLDRDEDGVLVRMKKIRKCVPIHGAVQRCGHDAVPRRLEPARGPKLEHVADIDQDHVIVDRGWGPALVVEIERR